jgi:type IV pilus assembly protein PilA
VRDEHGFTLIELMVVVLIVGVLVVIALPTFLGARTRAFDRATQSDVRNAFAAEKAYYTDTLTYTENAATMTAIEAAITYLPGDTPLVSDVVYLHLHPVQNEIYLSAVSDSASPETVLSSTSETRQFSSTGFSGAAAAATRGALGPLSARASNSRLACMGESSS